MAPTLQMVLYEPKLISLKSLQTSNIYNGHGWWINVPCLQYATTYMYVQEYLRLWIDGRGLWRRRTFISWKLIVDTFFRKRYVYIVLSINFKFHLILVMTWKLHFGQRTPSTNFKFHLILSARWPISSKYLGPSSCGGKHSRQEI